MKNKLMVAALCAVAGAAHAAPKQAYVRAVSSSVEEIRPLLNVGDGGNYRFAGIPDGMGAWRKDDGTFSIFINHEFRQSQGKVHAHGGTGAFVSEWNFNDFANGTGTPSDVPLEANFGRDAIRRVWDFNEETSEYNLLVNGRFGRLCSAYLARRASSGFDRDIFLTGEESGGVDTLDGKGGQSFALSNFVAYALPRMGRYAKENQVVIPHTSQKTVIIGLEDGPSTPESQLYIYVGRKDSGASSWVDKNGLNNGKLHAVKVHCVPTEESFRKNKTQDFSVMPVNWNQDEAGLEAEADAKGATGFIRIEDGASDPLHPGDFYFVTTGSPASTFNKNGRLYRLRFRDRLNPELGGTITMLLDGSEGIVSPDNIDINRNSQLLIQEDPTYTLTGRDASIWRYDLRTAKLTRLVEIKTELALTKDPAFTPGKWETSGIIDAGTILGSGWWLFNVQAHYAVADGELVEDGQLLAMKLSD